jgi:Ca-activated chloride channel homolog
VWVWEILKIQNYKHYDLHEAEKVLVQELTETLYAVADNSFINIQFNAAAVSKYRLIGFDNKKDAVQDGTSELDGGEMGSGSSTMAIFEIVPTKNNVENEVAKLQLKYSEHLAKPINPIITKEILFSINSVKDTTDAAVKFAAAVAMFGLKLKESPYLNNASWSQVKLTSEKATDNTNYLQSEFLKLLYRTIDLYEPSKKKKKKF